MSKATITEPVRLKSGVSYDIIYTVTNTGVDVCVHDQPKLIHVEWDKMGDVEFLSELFSDSAVCVFKQVVQRLGKLYAGKEAFDD
jgi:predicted methyltransferase